MLIQRPQACQATSPCSRNPLITAIAYLHSMPSIPQIEGYAVLHACCWAILRCSRNDLPSWHDHPLLEARLCSHRDTVCKVVDSLIVLLDPNATSQHIVWYRDE